MSYTLANRCFGICSNWSVFHSQLTHLRKMTQKNGYPENFIDRCFKLFLNRTHILREKKKKEKKNRLSDQSFPIQEAYHYKLGPNCRSPSKWYLTVVNYSLFSKVKLNPVITFTSKALFPKFLHQVRFASFSVNYAKNCIMENVLDTLL